MSSFGVDKKAADAVIKDMDCKIYEYSKRLAATKVKVRNLEKTLQDSLNRNTNTTVADTVCFHNEIETALKQANVTVQHIQDCVDCFTLVRTYCMQLVERVTDVDRLGVMLINSNALNMKKFDTKPQTTTEPYVTDDAGNKFYYALYNDLSTEEYKRLATLIGEDTVHKLMSVPKVENLATEPVAERTTN